MKKILSQWSTIVIVSNSEVLLPEVILYTICHFMNNRIYAMTNLDA
ncbi:MAG: hypothetical protein ACNI27_01110 [Desulfovibrio sp.]